MRDIQPIHPSIVQAICRIQTSLEAVKKSGRNAHGGYQFASTDDIYAALTRKMGEVGLVIMPLEVENDIVRVEKDGKTVQWLRCAFEFVFATTDATWHDARSRRSLFIQVTGPQTHQAAQSYAEKAFLRSVFKLPTGDMDLDSLPQADTEDAQEALNGNGRKRKSSAQSKRDGTDKTFNEIRAAFQECHSPDMLQHLRENYADDIATMAPAWADLIEGDYETRMIELRGRMS